MAGLTDGGERRESERLVLGERARVTPVSDAGRVGEPAACVIEDVSRRGVRVSLGGALEVGRMVAIETEGGERGLSGLVRWSRAAADGRLEAGIEAYRGASAEDFLRLVRRSRALRDSTGPQRRRRRAIRLGVAAAGRRGTGRGGPCAQPRAQPEGIVTSGRLSRAPVSLSENRIIRNPKDRLDLKSRSSM
jgi:hypothetical protein